MAEPPVHARFSFARRSDRFRICCVVLRGVCRDAVGLFPVGAGAKICLAAPTLSSELPRWEPGGGAMKPGTGRRSPFSSWSSYGWS